MNRTMITAVNTLGQLQQKLDIISHNMSNVDTNGYKRREATFAELINQQSLNMLRQDQEIGRLTPPGIRVGAGAKIAQSQVIGSQGSLQTTGRQLDFAFTKENQFFKVLVQEDGQGQVHYTRDGAFSVTPVNNNEVMLVTNEGHPVLDENDNIITFSSENGPISLREGGVLTIGEAQTVNLGVVQVNRPQFLEQKGANFFTLPANPAVPEDQIMRNLAALERNEIGLQQSTLEKSNVDFAKEMAELTNVQRSYQFQSRAISLSDQMMGLVNGIR
ncbi:flagellar basal-body rod protein FlgG [Bacillus ectoiniformans]|uniref:flagellar hook-basal body protein n=1 Tax=Bacillus ectoiniformans TaxID=1494429 RepID=UPI00195ABAF0|nr:flagellar hook-basal body protein [Bacillus ectoiniformans]MBM7648377.1 flagellar basal-body rod protein FlgG [Bacillus ectoiniformans]